MKTADLLRQPDVSDKRNNDFNPGGFDEWNSIHFEIVKRTHGGPWKGFSTGIQSPTVHNKNLQMQQTSEESCLSFREKYFLSLRSNNYMFVLH